MRDRARRAATRFVPPLLGFLALTLLLFAPLVRHLGDGVLRGPTDGAQVIRYLWMLDRIGASPFDVDRDPLLGAPEGVPVSSALEIVQPLQPALLWLGAPLVGETIAFNLFLIAGFVLTGFASYVLLHRLGLHPLAAFAGGTLIAFNPWMIERALEGHAAFVHAWPLVLLIGALVELHQRRTVPLAALAGGALALSFYATAYLGLLGVLVVAVFLCLAAVQSTDWPERLWVSSLACVLALTTSVALLPAAAAYLSDRDRVGAIAGHGRGELSSYSATIGSYVRPSPEHPLLGSLGIDVEIGSGDAERVLYVGLTTVALAVISVLMLRRGFPAPGTRLRTTLLGALIIAPSAFLLSLPPHVTVLGASIPLPSAAIGAVTSYYRVYARFGFLVVLSLALLAASALHVLLSERRQPLVAAMAGGLVALEFLPGILPVWTASPRASDRWLAERPVGIVANYPMPTDQPAATRLALEEQYLQRFHGHPLYTLISGGTGGTREQAIRIVTRYLTAPETPGILAAEGVRYVLLHDDVYRAQGEQPPEPPGGIRLVARADNVRILEVDPDLPPADVDAVLEEQAAAVATVQGLPAPTVRLTSGYSERHQDGWWELRDEGTLDIRTPDPRVTRGLVQFQARSESVEQTIRLLDGERVVGEAFVGTTPAMLELGPVAFGPSGVRLRLIAAQTEGVAITTPTIQPLADFSVSLRKRR